MLEYGYSDTVFRRRQSFARKVDWSRSILLISDVHWDHPYCDRKLLARHLRQAVDRDADIYIIGDLLDVMQGRDDRRGNKEAVRPEHRRDDYFDAVVETCAEWLEPYAKNIAMISLGNHETAVLKRQEINLAARLVGDLRRMGSDVQLGGYAGWIMHSFNDLPYKQTIKHYYHHGHGGGGPVTRGVIGTNRRAVYLPDADLVTTGHVHEAWSVEITRERVTQAGKVIYDTQYHLQIPTYKDEHSQGKGWHIETGKPPKPMGGWWVNFRWSQSAKRVVMAPERTEQ